MHPPAPSVSFLSQSAPSFSSWCHPAAWGKSISIKRDILEKPALRQEAAGLLYHWAGRWGQRGWLTEEAKSGNNTPNGLGAENGWRQGSSVMKGRKTENAGRKGPSCVSKQGEKSNSKFKLCGALSCTSCFFLSSSTWLTLLWGAAGRGAWATYNTGVQRLPTDYDVKTKDCITEVAFFYTVYGKNTLTHTQMGEASDMPD